MKFNYHHNHGSHRHRTCHAKPNRDFRRSASEIINISLNSALPTPRHGARVVSGVRPITPPVTMEVTPTIEVAPTIQTIVSEQAPPRQAGSSLVIDIPEIPQIEVLPSDSTFVFTPRPERLGWRNGAIVESISPLNHATEASTAILNASVTVSSPELRYTLDQVKDSANILRRLLENNLPEEDTKQFIQNLSQLPAQIRNRIFHQFSQWTKDEIFRPAESQGRFEFISTKSPLIQNSALDADSKGTYQFLDLFMQLLVQKSEDQITHLGPVMGQIIEIIRPDLWNRRYDAEGDLTHHSLCRYLLTNHSFSSASSANLLKHLYQRRSVYGGINLFAQKTKESGETMLQILAETAPEYADTELKRAEVIKIVLDNIGIEHTRTLMIESGFTSLQTISHLPEGPIKTILSRAIEGCST